MSQARNLARGALADRFMSDFAAEYPSVPIKFENQKFTQPDTAWVCFYMRWPASHRASIGTENSFRRHHGMACIDVYVPEDTGTASMLQMAEFAENILVDTNLTLSDGSYITTYQSKCTVYGLVDGYYMCTIFLPFCLDAV